MHEAPEVMHVALPATVSSLDLPDPGALFGTPANVDGGVIRQALETALDRVSQVPALPFAGWRLRVLAEAGRVLLAEPAHPAAAIHLTQLAVPDLADTAALAHVRLIALWQMGLRDETIAEAERILSLRSHPAAERRALTSTIRRWNIERRIPARIERLPDFWPDIAAAIADPAATLDTEERNLLTPAQFEWLCALRGLTDQGAIADFRRRMCRGAELSRRLRFTRQLTRKIRRGQTVPGFGEDEARLLALMDRLDSLRCLPDPAPVFAACAEGRSVLLVMAHAGMVLGNGNLMPDRDFPCTTISHGPIPPNPARPQDGHVSTGAADAPLAFARLAKAMRKGPRIVRIHPDGPDGETTALPLLGRQVRIGRGAAFLAFHGRADVYFINSHWNGQVIAFDLLAGPRAVDHADRGSFEQAFNAFYASRLAQILLGPPEDMVPDGGFWHWL
jgi:hypothetical protein